ncbi:MAG TPA: hypothetical protein VN317_02625 [Candidatus Methanoperedens sp.]|nr:hypothetical protein [Candidatus Methanoperedens sp.]
MGKNDSDRRTFETDGAVQEVDDSPRPPVPSGMVGDPRTPARGKAPTFIAVGLVITWTVMVLGAVVVEYAKGNTTGGLEIGKGYLSQFVLMAVGWLYGRGLPGR